METTSVTEILQTVTGSVDFSSLDTYPGADEDEQRTNFWIEVIRVKSSDTGFGHLVDSIMEEGFHDSAIGWHDGRIYEGHHRLVAAILLGLDTVLTTPYGRGGSHEPREGMNGYFTAHDSCDIDTSIEVEL